jgi:uncharacterized membrane protein
MIIAEYLHILGFTIWIGGMFFAYMALRPVAANKLEGPIRMAVWAGVLGKFFPWVWLSIALILGSGLHMMAQIGRPPLYVTVMFVLGVLMMLIFAHIFFAPYRRLKGAVSKMDGPKGGAALGQIRKLVGTNLVLGLITLTVGALGPLWR